MFLVTSKIGSHFFRSIYMFNQVAQAGLSMRFREIKNKNRNVLDPHQVGESVGKRRTCACQSSIKAEGPVTSNEAFKPSETKHVI